MEFAVGSSEPLSVSNTRSRRQLFVPRTHYALVACLALIVISFSMFGFTLDRYPLPFVDDTAFNYPAIRYLEGKPFAYPMATTAPYGDRLWAYQSPLYPRLQILTFGLFGVSERNCRLPQYVAAHLAILLLCVTLLRRDLPWTAIFIAIAWLGDRGHLEVTKGRPDGFTLLALSLAFCSLLRYVERPRLGWSFAVGLFSALAAGFHPGAIVFIGPSLVVLAATASRQKQGRHALAFLAGYGLLGLVVLWNVSFDWRGGLEQFIWHAKIITNLPYNVKLQFVAGRLAWAIGWPIALAVMTIAMFPRAARAVRLGQLRRSTEPPSRVWTVASLFAITGLACFLGTSVHAHHLIEFTIWPVIALASTLESQVLGRRRRELFGACVVIALLWLPALATNLGECFWTLRNYERLDRAAAARQIAAVVPQRAEFVCSPSLYFLAKDAGLRVSIFSWAPRQPCAAPANSYLLVIKSEYGDRQLQIEPKGERHFVGQWEAFPGIDDFPFVLVSPIHAAIFSANDCVTTCPASCHLAGF
jgi:hypothetical protein